MPDLFTSLRRLPALLSIWLARSEQRRALEEMDECRLRDIGLTRRQARSEAARPFWSGKAISPHASAGLARDVIGELRRASCLQPDPPATNESGAEAPL